MEKIFTSIYGFFEKRRVVFFTCFVLSFLLLGYLASRVKFEEDISKILPKDKKIEKLNEVFQQSRFMDKLVLMVSLTNEKAEPQPDKLVMYADSLSDRVQQQLSPYVKKVNGRVDDGLTLELFGTISDNLPVFLGEQDYKAIDTLLQPAQVKATLEQDLRTLNSPAGFALKQMISKDPTGISLLGLKKLQQLQYDDNFELYDGYVMTKDQRYLLLFIEPVYPPNNTGKNALFLEGLDKAMQETQSYHYPDVQAAYFGATAVSVGNALQLRKDSLLTQGITVLFIIVFLGLYFRKKRAPLIILVPVLFGALFALSMIGLIKGQISVIALGTGSVVLGIAVNYSLHVFNHYRHTKNIYTVLRDLAQPMTVGSFTTIGGFFCLEFVESEMLKDLGLFGAFSLIGASLCSLIFLPHMVVSRKEKRTAAVKNELSWLDKIAGYRPEYNKYLVIVILALTVFFAFYAGKVKFESDLLRMNYMRNDLKAAEQQLNRINAFALQSVYLVTEGKNLDDALIKNEKLSRRIEDMERQGIVKKHSGVGSLIISDSLQQLRINRWNSYWTTGKKQALLSTLEKEGVALGFRASAFGNFREMLDKVYAPVPDSLLQPVRNNLLGDYINESPGKASVVTLLKVTPESKNNIYTHFENEPGVTVLDKQYLASRFVDIVNNDFSSIALMTSMLVFIVLLIMYGRIELTLVSFIPMFISWIWILGIMALADIQFNIINIIVSALIFGLGDDYSLFIMDGLLQEYKTGKKNLSSFKSSIFLSAITTIAGLGVLIFAKHPALKSIAFISIIGIICVVIMSQILIPFFFNMLIRNRVTKGRYPWTLSGFIKSSFAFSWFIGWSLFFTPVAWVLEKLRVGEKGKHAFHWLLAKTCWSLVYIMFNVKKRIINPQKEKFSKPAIIICNHQSSLDIVPLIMLHPKLIMFTNNRIWNSPLFGAVIRVADYFPAEQVEQNIGLVEDRIRRGYSVIIFPEGTRSESGVIGRFHKGAFFLAEKLQLDILPIMIHGTNYTLTKQDKLLKDGQVSVKILPRITPTDTRYGATYSERAKGIGRYFREEFEALRSSIEQPSYFREKLLYNYIYKGPVLEWYMRIKTRMEKNYRLFHELVPQKGKILDIGCGYGFMSYMLHFVSPEREMLGLDYDERKIETAQHCFSKTNRVNFECADIMQYEFTRQDAIIMADMLHYLKPADQQTLIRKCISSLNDGGVLVIRDGDAEKQEKHRKTVWTEIWSTRILKFNKTVEELSFLSGSTIRSIAAEYGMECKEIENDKSTSNVVFVLKMKK